MDTENNTAEEKSLTQLNTSIEEIPETLTILLVDDQVAFPGLNMTLAVNRDVVASLDDVMRKNQIIGIMGVKKETTTLSTKERAVGTGTAVRILYISRTEEEHALLVVHGLSRFRIAQWLENEPFLKARVRPAPEVIETDIEIEALHRNLRDLSQEVFTLSLNAPKEAIEGLSRITSPMGLAYIAAAHADIDFDRRKHLLDEDSLKAKLRELVAIFSHEKEVLALGKKIQNDTHEEMSKRQREYYLRQQLNAIKKELGESDVEQSEAELYRQRIDETEMSAEAREEAERELDRFAEMTPQSAEYSMLKTYLDWLLDLPWNRTSQDQADIAAARRILDEDHFGLQAVKDRIIEYLAVRNLLKIRTPEQGKNANPTPFSTSAGVILCFSGPPGVGKTSLGQSIARAMGREFTRMSLGGIRDEAEIRGHRRTYIGAMPGRIIQAIKRAGTRNPVFMLDEVDKIGTDWRGDPSSALLEVLDPAQNSAFRDHYLDVDFDLSDIVFIATANQLDNIPAPLRDRLEVIELDGYTESEKVQIAKQHLIPRQLAGHGLNDTEVTFMDKAIRKIIGSYTREAGVRQLERLIGSICRKCVVSLTTSGWSHIMVTPEHISDYLKKEKFESELSEEIDTPGVATGLAVTATGGDILFIEATRMKGNEGLKLTGQLGEVMQESAQIAHSYIRSQANLLSLDTESFKNTDVHLHVPAGSVPKDGPSAGIAMVLALGSLFSGRPVRGDVGMTGEVTLRGRVLPVGGIKMKVLAAHRAGLKTVILPQRNARDLDDIPPEVRKSMRFVPVDRIGEAIEVALSPGDGLPGRSRDGFSGDPDRLDENVMARESVADSL